MKKKIKILSLFSLTLLLLFISCEKDLYDEAIQTERNIKISKVSIKDPDIINNRNLMSEILNIKEKQSLLQASSRIVYDSINNFYFDDENGIKIEDGVFESYTFKIYRESNIENYDIENIVFTSNTNGNYNVDLVKYSLSETENTKINNGEFVDLSSNAQVTSLSRFNIDPCFKIVSFPVSYNEEGGVTYSMNILVEIPCPDLGEGGTGGNGGTGGGTGEYNGPTGPIGSPWEGSSIEGNYGSDPILTSPVGSGGSSSLLVSPCKKTKKQLEKYTTLKPALVTLAGTTSASQENGIYIYDTATSTTPNPVQNLPNTTIAGVTAVGLPNPTPPNKYTVIGHTHDASGPLGTGSFSIFSWQDLTRLAELIHDGYMDNDNFVFYLATADGTRYALTTEWPTSFADYFDRRITFGIPESPTNLNYNKAVELGKSEKKYYSNAPLTNKIHLTSNKNDDLINFLKMQKELKLNFTLFEVDSTFSTYTKVSLKSDGTIKRETCN